MGFGARRVVAWGLRSQVLFLFGDGRGRQQGSQTRQLGGLVFDCIVDTPAPRDARIPRFAPLPHLQRQFADLQGSGILPSDGLPSSALVSKTHTP